MKDHSNEYALEEEGSQKKPLEIYDIWYSTNYWRYTSTDYEVTYNSNTYAPAPIERGVVVYDSNLEVSALDITFARSQGPITRFIVSNPVLALWIKITRLMEDDEGNYLEPDIIFIGQIKNVSFKGLTARANCVGFENYLRQPVPHYRYQELCNWRVFDTKCAKSDVGFKVTTNLTAVSSDGLTLTSSDFALQDADYYTLGKVTFGDDARMIVEHIDDYIKLRFPFQGTVIGSQVTAYAGCDRNIETCKTKFNNVINFGGHPFIPLDNPVFWI